MSDLTHIHWLLCGAFLCLPLHSILGQHTYTYEERRLQEIGSAEHYFTVDGQGFIWGKNDQGDLFRFDGFEKKFFFPNPTDTTHICGHDPLWVWTDGKGQVWPHLFSCGLARYDPERGQFATITEDLWRVSGVQPRSFAAITEDAAGDLWISTQIGVFYYSLSGQPIRYYRTPEGAGAAIDLWQDRNGVFWGLTGRSRVYRLVRLDPAQDTMTVVHTLPRMLGPYSDQRILPLGSDQLIITNAQPFYRFDTKDLSVTPFDQHPLGEAVITAAYREGDGYVLGTSDGRIFHYDPATGRFTLLYRHRPAQTDQPVAVITSLLRTAGGVIWFSADRSYKLLPDRGVDRLPAGCLPDQYSCLVITYQGNAFSFSDAGLVPLRGGAEIADRFNRSFRPPPVNSFIAAAEAANGTLWVITSFSRRGGPAHLYAYDRDGRLLVDFFTEKDIPPITGTMHGPFMDLAIDRRGDLWIGSWWHGLYAFDPDSMAIRNFIHYPDGGPLLKRMHLHAGQPSALKANSLRYLFVDSRDQLWIGYHNKGISRFDPQTHSFSPAVADTGTCAVPETYVSCIGEDPWGSIWVGTAVGLYRYTPGEDCWRRYSRADGLGHDMISTFVKNRNDDWWVVTAAGTIDRYDPKKDKFHTIVDSGTPYAATRATADSAGFIYILFGDRTLSFHSDSIVQDRTPPPVVLTDLLLFNERSEPGSDDGVLSKEMPFTSDVTLRYRQNVVTVKYSALEYGQPGRVRFSYRLEGFDSDWQYVGNRREATYTNLSPGSYTFRLRSSLNFGPWSDPGKVLHLTVLPPWYRTYWAYGAYGVLGILLLFLAFRYQYRRVSLRARLRYEHREAERLKELEEARTRLYTNITHEFRTPLTVILGMVDQIQRQPKAWFKEGLAMIRRNGNNLLRLVNQMLDLAKLEAGSLPTHLIRGDVIAYLQYLIESFHSLAEKRSIQLHFSTAEASLRVDYDLDKLRDITANLLSNALNYTPAGGTVYVEVQRLPGEEDGEWLRFSIRDTGIGIAAEELPNIFDRFYQVDDSSVRKQAGTGIGLALTAELVSLLGGKISARSTPGEGSEFTVCLPISRTAPALEENAAPYRAAAAGFEAPGTTIEAEPVLADQPAGEPLALLIEDNPDVIRYLTACLQDNYRLEVAFDGLAGETKARRLLPDIIISDVMMPGADGFEVCRRLKQNLLTSHIPIVLLTAKADTASRIEGLTRGADAYLAKPFNKEELLVRLQQLIELRRQLQDYYRQLALTGNLGDSEVTAEDAFVEQVRSTMVAHLSDEDFGMTELCTSLGISRAQLYRKFSSLTGQSVGQYFRKMRLQKARALLQHTDWQIAEVAYRTGFASPAYFSRAFKEYYGQSPSDWRAAVGSF